MHQSIVQTQVFCSKDFTRNNEKLSFIQTKISIIPYFEKHEDHRLAKPHKHTTFITNLFLRQYTCANSHWKSVIKILQKEKYMKL